jgi:transposase-like protein
MGHDTVIGLEREMETSCRSALDETLRTGAERMLQAAVEREVAEYIQQHEKAVDGETGHRQVVRNGHRAERGVQTPLGTISVRQPRVDDRREGHRFESIILPPYLRRSPAIEALIPLLYLKGVSSNDMPDALEAILGTRPKGLSPTTITRLKEAWEKEFEEWNGRDLTGKRYVYLWADGIYFNVRLEKDRPCLLVLMGTLEDGSKELVAIHDGQRESKLSWQSVLRDLKRRGLEKGPELAIGDGALGFWAALSEMFPDTRCQRCWVHKTANILDKMPKRVQPDAKKLIHEMYMAETRKQAMEAYEEFCERYKAKFPNAVACLRKDEDALFAFYDFPAEHWVHIRTTNPIESAFATIRHRQRQTKGCGTRVATLAMVYKLAREAEKHWRRITGYALVAKVLQGVKFEDGIEVDAA